VFEACLGYTVIPCLKKKNPKKLLYQKKTPLFLYKRNIFNVCPIAFFSLKPYLNFLFVFFAYRITHINGNFNC
jgi:hypothetical protein